VSPVEEKYPVLSIDIPLRSPTTAAQLLPVVMVSVSSPLTGKVSVGLMFDQGEQDED